MCSGNRVPFIALNIALVVNHYGRYHRHDPDFYVTCKVDGCIASYRKFEGYKSHLRRHHKEIDFCVEQAENAPNNTTEVDREHLNFEETLMGIDEEERCGPPVDEIDLQKQNALFLLKTKEIHQLTQKATDSVVSDATCIVKNAVEQLKLRVENCLDSAEIRFNDIPGLEDVFKADSPECNPFNGLQTKTEQKRYFRENFGLVVSSRAFIK